MYSGSYYSSIKHHKLKRRVELKERKILEILKNHFGPFFKSKNNNINFILAMLYVSGFCSYSWQKLELPDSEFVFKTEQKT